MPKTADLHWHGSAARSKCGCLCCAIWLRGGHRKAPSRGHLLPSEAPWQGLSGKETEAMLPRMVSLQSRRTAFLMARALGLEHLGHLTRISQKVEGLEQHG